MSTQSDNKQPTWSDYYQKVIERPHDPRTERAIKSLQGQAFTAVDGGCGAGRDTAYLLQQGLVVHAFDPDPDAMKICEKRFEGESRLSLTQASFETYDYPLCDVFIAHNALFFCTSDLTNVWRSMISSVKSGGIISADFLGEKDSWVTSSKHDVQAISKENIEALLSECEVLDFLETDRFGKTALGFEKHWHTYSVLVRTN